ncbi:uncharacterized protein LOC132352292 isoform X2 [Balaenoptera ricei]|uniref:uncharacterized protein LOC132352292 isoform X2 n=1 Tax=Balaenoptera ricei TaxID=2746895 RepID=UPI0028BE195C|nr:uncharacterized protein LOC132352292 isoform X2 [Balaenoptera ricei]
MVTASRAQSTCHDFPDGKVLEVSSLKRFPELTSTRQQAVFLLEPPAVSISESVPASRGCLPSSAQRPLHLHATQNFSTSTRSQVSSGKDNAPGDHHLPRPPRHLLGFACDTAGNASHSTPFLSRVRYHTKSNQSCS